MTGHLQRLEDREGESFGPELVLRGARDRLTPILTTTFAIVLAFVPFMLAGDTAGVEWCVPWPLSLWAG
jgi:Cu/Ag efflux pump CusA